MELKTLKEVLFGFHPEAQIHVIDISDDLNMSNDVLEGFYFEANSYDRMEEFLKVIPYMDYIVVRIYDRKIESKRSPLRGEIEVVEIVICKDYLDSNVYDKKKEEL